MAYDNSELLKNYVHAFQTFGDAEFARVARGILRWMEEVLSDREQGGFYASQDADASLEDDGDYWTWTRDEAREVLSAEEFEVAAMYFNLRDVGDMRHDPQKCVLHVGGDAAGGSATPLMNGGAVHEWGTRVEVVREKMLAARLRRKMPYVDRTIYTGWNGMCCSATLEAGRVLGMPGVVEFALKSLDRVLGEAWSAELGLGHVVAYGEGVSGARIAGGLEDYAFVAGAALDAWEATGELKYYAMAREIADAMVERFYDAAGGGFFDAERVEGAIGVLSARRKPVQDAPVPAGNSVAAGMLLRLGVLTGDASYEAKAWETLEAFAGVVEHFGLYAASYGLALRRAVEGAVQVCVVGRGGQELEAAALRKFVVGKSVVRLETVGELPAGLAETLPHLDVGEGAVALVCRGRSCLPPMGTVEELVAIL
jgi:hypothetical protein